MDIAHRLPEPRSFPTADAPHAPLSHPPGLTRASTMQTLGVFLNVILPTVAKGVIIRRPGALAMAERLDLDRRAVRHLQRLRSRHGSAPLLLRIPLRHQLLLLDPSHVHRVLEGTPRPFSPASSEKRAALAHFEPKGSLVTPGPERTVRRRLNEQALESDSPVHSLGQRFVSVVDEEARLLVDAAGRRGALTWPAFEIAWLRVVRRVVFGDAARDEHAITDLMTTLRSHANWAFLWPRDDGKRERLHHLIRSHIRRAEPGSLASVIAALRPPTATHPEQQIPQWLFAFDPAGMTTFRSLALLATHPMQAPRAMDEVRGGQREHLPFLRATVLESLRLWPTTPLLLRQTNEPTRWEGGEMPAGTGVMIYAPFFHRDDQTQPYADRFEPGLWLRERSTQDWPLVPFSSGPAVCPGRHLVLMLTSAMLAALLERRTPRLLSHGFDANQRLPGTLSHFALRFELQ
jgi:cytochrome P450